MSVQVNLRSLPSHVLDCVYRPETVLVNRSESAASALTFPKSRVALWDPTRTGDVLSLHLFYYRNPRLRLLEKALRLAHRHARQCNKPQMPCFFLGTLTVDADEEGVTLTLDRFDPGREQSGSAAKTPMAVLPGDVVVPCVVEPVFADTLVHSANDFSASIKMLQHCCSSRETLELAKLLMLQGRLRCAEQMDRLQFSLHWAAVAPGSVLEAVPIRAVPIIPTALVRNLSGPVAQCVSGDRQKRGYLTMDQTRKLLLMLESDPKIYTLPLVGVWLCGVTHIHNPQVWAWCLRYLHSSSLQDRVMSEGGAFLVVLYSLTHREPEFYECQLSSGQPEVNFQLLTSTKCLTIYKNVEPPEGQLLQFELSTESQNKEKEHFKEALSALRTTTAASTSPRNKLSISDHDSGVEDEDLSPRPSPNPYPGSEQVKLLVQPTVPELSLLMDGSYVEYRNAGPCDATTHHSSLPSVLKFRAEGETSTQTNSGSKPPGQVAHSGPPPIRRPLIPGMSQVRACKGHPSPGQQAPLPSLSRESGPSVRTKTKERSPASFSSSPKTGLSPNGPYQKSLTGTSCLKPFTNSTHQPALTPNGFPGPTSTQAPSHIQMFHSTPCSNPSLNTMGKSSVCCAHQHGYVQSCPPSSWQNKSPSPGPMHETPGNTVGVFCASDGVPHRDCCLSPPRPQMGCGTPPHQGPTCNSNTPTHYSPTHGACSPHGRGLQQHSGAPICQAQCWQLRPGCSGLLGIPSEGQTGILPADAYKMLVEQDRQLKLLQAQIQKLLEAQNPKASSPPPAQESPEQPNRFSQQTATAVLTSIEPKESVSVAVGTGASLFWGSEEWQAEATTGVDIKTSPPSRSSSVHSQNHNTSNGEEVEEDQDQNSSFNRTRTPNQRVPDAGTSSFQSPVLGESASMYIQPQSPAREGQTHSEDQRFYQELLGQVNDRLQGTLDCVQENSQDKWREQPMDTHSSCPVGSQSCKLQTPKQEIVPSSKVKQTRHGDQVLGATLKQLQQLGVSVDLHAASKDAATRNTIESASTLARINPEAVIPRLALSDPVGDSLWVPGGSADLSLEANAIALKYLSDSQLSRLSLGRSAENKPSPSSVLLSRMSVEKSSVGLSILSPSNMSIATRKYMKRYGLIEGGEVSEDEEEEREQTVQHYSALGCSTQLEDSGNVSAGQDVENVAGFILKNVSNKLGQSAQMTPDSQSQLFRNLRPKMQLLTDMHGDKENNAKIKPSKRHSSTSENRRPPGPAVEQGSVGNFLDLSRLRQLPKLF
ncbi:SCL-interrupting locus protein homolog [Denticeps clupeoides]|uniref:SCL-interrupting locus protein homolog n=1 Tax=Denticeps clupeoides TaxID=299321 RepID=UPI0010A51849|nr:SCL-interrupting locus protein [Denticeps clupeoides]